MSETEAPVLPAKTREQVVAQYRVVAHLARQIALVHEQCAETYAHTGTPMRDGFIDFIGEQTAQRMEVLGNMLNGMDAVTEDDVWVDLIFSVAQATWPRTRDAS